SLLLGSAAALAVVSGAQAADAVVAAEPEPMEYVRVCDAYGTGFFYIPGTETCLKISGQLRYEKRFSRTGDQGAAYDNHSRARIHFDARNDSEWGTVYSWVRIQGDQVNNGEDIEGNGRNSYLRFYYYFGIGGLEFGNFDSQWAKFMGYGGRTDDGGVYTSDWNYPDSRQYVSYTADFGNFKAFVSLDNDADEFFGSDDFVVAGDGNGDGIVTPGETMIVTKNGEDHDGDIGTKAHKGRKYLPDISAGVSGTFGDYSAAAAIAYDESDESFAVKKVIRGDIGMFGFTAMGLYSNSSENIYFAYDGFSAIIGLSAKVTDTVTIAKDIQWFDNGDWRLVGDVNWEVATGFSVLVEGVYFNPDKGADTKAGMLRFQRNF
ncbi:MAG: porin, partial [Rhizobium sp.]|nr:porin [Rhizobium sp.]